MTTEISGLIDPIAELAASGSPSVSVVATRDDRWDARSYLVSSGVDAVLIDGNGNLEPLVAHAGAQGLELHAALLTHTHEDHVAGIAELRASGLPVLAHADAPGGFHDRDLHVGGVVKFGELVIEPIHLPGHDAAQFAYRTGGVVVTGDSIYRHTVAGHSEPSETSFAEHMSGIDGRILTLARDTVILPGHGPATTVSDELAANPFIRLFRGDDEPPPPRDCRVGGPFGLWEAELVLLAVDYDGGRKALVRFPTIGRSIVPGSQLYTADGQPWPMDA
jgi:glyoxylase-like metal-dependent hydrolase (beta-lactamase superfamily II)